MHEVLLISPGQAFDLTFRFLGYDLPQAEGSYLELDLCD